MKQLCMGIIGTGMAFERLHYPAYQELSNEYRIIALCDSNRGKSAEWAGRLGLGQDRVYTDFHEMLKRDDIDAVDIMVPIPQNYEVAEAVAASGLPFICEKPLAPTLEQARAHRDLPKKYGVPVMIAENYRYNDEVNLIRDVVRTEKAGRPVYFIQNRVVFFPGDMLKNKFPATEWRQHAFFPGGALLDTGVHDMAALRHIFGAIDRLHAFGVPQDDEFSPYAAVSVNLQFKSGVTGNFSFYCAGKEMQRPLIGLRIFGTGGIIYLEERDCGVVNIAYNDGRSEQIPYRPQRGFYNELLNFYKAATGKEPISVTPEMEYGDAKTIFDILKSIREERVISVDEELSYTPGYNLPEREVPANRHYQI